MNADTQPITVSVDPAGKVFLQETEIPIEEIVPKRLNTQADAAISAPTERLNLLTLHEEPAIRNT